MIYMKRIYIMVDAFDEAGCDRMKYNLTNCQLQHCHYRVSRKLTIEEVLTDKRFAMDILRR